MQTHVYTSEAVETRNALAVITRQRNDYFKFGEADSLPNFIVSVVNNSGTARECIDKLQTFIYGNGFKDPNVAKTVANLDGDYNKLLSDLALNNGYSDAVTFRVLMDNEGVAARAYPLQWQQLRRKGKKIFTYNPLMGEYGMLRSQTREARIYDPAESPAERKARMIKQIETYGEQFGDIVYMFNKGVGVGYDIYSIPKYYSGIDDIESDAGVTRLELRNIKKGWRANVVISTGPIDNQVEDEKGTTAKQRFDANIKKFTGEDGASILHIDGAVNEAKPEVKIMDTAAILDQTDKATDRIGRKVCRHMGVPPVLCGFATAGQLGNNQELINTMELFKLSVIKRQDLISSALKMVFPSQDFTISPSTLWSTVTPAAV